MSICQDIVAALDAEIAAGKFPPGGRIPGTPELRERFGVSHVTVLRAYRELARRQLIFRRDGMGYFVAERGRRRVATGRVGIFLRPLRNLDRSDNYFNRINQGLQDELFRCQLAIIGHPAAAPLNFIPISESSLRAVAAGVIALNAEVDGFILDERIPDTELAGILRRIDRPAVVVGRPSQLPVSTVHSPNADGIAALLDYALKLGYRNFLFGVSGVPLVNLDARRAEFRRQAEARGLVWGECLDLLVPGASEEVARLIDAASAGFGSGKLALLADCDYCARAALLARPFLTRPVGVAGFDGMPVDGVPSGVRLTTVAVAPEELGRCAARLLQELGDPARRGAPETVEPGFRLVPGDTL